MKINFPRREIGVNPAESSMRLPWSGEAESVFAAGENAGFTKSADRLSFDREYRIEEGEILEIVRGGVSPS